MSDPGHRTFGDRTAFAIEAALLADPHPDGAAVEDVWSYGEFRIYVRNRCLTRHTVPGGMRDEIRWYLAPLFRWLSTAWLPLLHEQRAPSLVGSHDNLVVRFEQGKGCLWMTRVRAAPRVELGCRPGASDMRCGRRRRVACSRTSGSSARATSARSPSIRESRSAPPRVFEFQFNRGTVLVDVAVVAGALGDFLRWGAKKGRASGVDIPLPEETEAAARAAERWLLGDHLTRILTHAGVAPSRLDHGAIARPSPEVAMFGTLRPELSSSDARRLLDRLEAARTDDAEPSTLLALTEAMPLPTRDTAWEQGYDLASLTLDAIAARASSAGPFIDIAAILGGLGVTVDGMQIEDASLRGVAIAGEGFRPTILVNDRASWNRSAPGRRFTLAHEFAHLLVDRGRARSVTHSSTPWAPEAVERRVNAFAAMFLMPYRAIDAAASEIGEVVDAQRLKRMARRLRCGRAALLEHLKNLGRIEAGTYHRIRVELGGEPLPV